LLGGKEGEVIKCHYCAYFEGPEESCAIWKQSEIPFLPTVGMTVCFEYYRRMFVVEDLEWDASENLLAITFETITYSRHTEYDAVLHELITKHGWEA